MGAEGEIERRKRFDVAVDFFSGTGDPDKDAMSLNSGDRKLLEGAVRVARAS